MKFVLRDESDEYYAGEADSGFGCYKPYTTPEIDAAKLFEARIDARLIVCDQILPGGRWTPVAVCIARK